MTFVNDEGEVLDFDGFFALTKRSVSFFNSRIQGDYSINFSVDNNSVTRKFLNYDGPQMLNQVAFTRHAVTAVRNGNALARGFIVIQNDLGKTLSCYFISGNSNWINLLTGLITELDYSGVTNGVNYIVQLPEASTFPFTTSGITYPLVDWCYDLRKGSNDWFNGNILDSRADQYQVYFERYPCFYLHSLVTEIVKQNGLKVAGNVLDNPLYNKIVITPVNGSIKREAINLMTAYGTPQTTSSATYVQYTNLSESTDPEGLFSSDVYTSGRFSKLIITVNVNSVSGTGAYVGTLAIRRNGAAIFTIQVGDATGSNDIGIGVYTREVPASSNVAGDQYDLAFKLDAGTDVTLDLDLKVNVPTEITSRDTVLPNHFLPKMSCLEVIKFVINYFGCVTYYDEYSKTITINQIEKIKAEDAQDWSQYFVSSETDYTQASAQNNYLKLTEASDTDIKAYNKENILNYGDGVVETGNTLKPQQDIFKLPFAPSGFGLSKNGYWMANVPLVRLKDAGDPFQYTAIVDDGSGNAVFQYVGEVALATDATFVNRTHGQAVRIVDDDSGDAGIFIVSASSVSLGVVSVEVFGYPYPGATGTGKIYLQEREYRQVEPRFLVVDHQVSPASLAAGVSEWPLYSTGGSVTGLTSISNAYFCKQLTGLGLDNYISNLAIQNPNLELFTFPGVQTLYFSKIASMMGNPVFSVVMILPESVFQSFEFGTFIYLKTKDLTGYFWVESISNYQDSVTPVSVKLLML